MLITLNHLKVVEDFVGKKVYGEKYSFIQLICVVGVHWNCLNEDILMCLTTYVTEIKETYF